MKTGIFRSRRTRKGQFGNNTTTNGLTSSWSLPSTTENKKGLHPDQKHGPSGCFQLSRWMTAAFDSKNFNFNVVKKYRWSSLAKLLLGAVLVHALVLGSSVAREVRMESIQTERIYRGRIYYCGYRFPLAEYIFPEYKFMEGPPWSVPESGSETETESESESESNTNTNTNTNSTHSNVTDHKNDILVYGMWGPGCDSEEKKDAKEVFAGKILYVNSEPEGDVVSKWYAPYAKNYSKYPLNFTKGVYQIGPYPSETIEENEEEPTFFNAHSLQVYTVTSSFLSSHLGLDKLSDVDPFEEHGNEETIEIPKPPPVFDPWKQLVEGNGRSSDAGPEPPRIPAVVYVSRNCVYFRQQAAAVLAKVFVGLATSGVTIESGSSSTSKIDPSNGNQRRLGESQSKDGVAADFQALHERAAEFNEAIQKTGGGPRSMNPRISTASEDADAFMDNASESDETPSSPSSFVHYGGQCEVEGGIPVPSTVMEGWVNTDRSKFQSNYETIYTRYKYCLVMENTKKDGYVTEKLMHALLGGCFPIYYGSKDVYKIFRNDAFVYFDIDNPWSAIDEIRRLENDDAEFRRRIDRKLPLLKATGSSRYKTAETVDQYFSLLPDIGTGKLCREIHEMMGLPLPDSLLPPKSKWKWKW